MDNYSHGRSRRRSRVRKRVGAALIVFFLLLIGIGLFSVLKYLTVIPQVLFNKGVHLKETKEKQINMLLLGIGGGTHEGPDLTDTIIFASIDPQNKHVTLVSLPRDLWVPDLNAKINATYTFAEEKKPGSGLQVMKKTVGNILGQQVDYGFKIDFGGFTKAVDMMGGLDITVDNTFDDYAYPITGKEDDACGHTDTEIVDLTSQEASGSASDLDAFPCRYEHLHFDKGPTHMDGTTALKYVRSRHAEGIEGSDFSRSKRQQKVIAAFKEKLLSAGTLLNPVKITNLVEVLKGSIETDIQPDEYDDFVRLAQEMKGVPIKSTVLDVGEGDRLGLLVNPPISPEYGNAWVLSPRSGNGQYAEIQEYVRCVLSGSVCTVAENGITTPTPIPTKAPIKK